ncbi:dihydrolipoyllysine-residue acetyltransferase [Oxalobacter vibrioformis]|uniref:Dihydrolipoamide acetyltransferase component of pyruvate dehydrogenase complex n=1 Tax=Oxalobacter vibrioformis TaxID=933080 RepID=A0A9E9LYJ5_9BURK|nr:dihydrolipoyllysine-residue acetyltransferase [Oxalobacter vibrioformis]WAW11087.1 dihydrolipoyllysine-residue acetyltransferase [Oxalobacter vibrioformis]
MSLEEIRVPDIGDFKAVDVIEVMVSVGDRIRRDQSLVTVESDKASMEIPSPRDGVVRELKVSLGDKVSEGALLLIMEVDEALVPEKEESPAAPSAEKIEPPAEASPPPASLPDLSTEPVPEPVSASGGVAHASPSVRKFARELGVDLSRVRGSGPKARILREDVLAFVKSSLAGGASPGGGLAGYADFPVWPSLDFSAFGPTEKLPLSRIKQISGPNLHRNLLMIPHVTQYEDADVTELESFRQSENKRLEAEGVRLTMLSFVIKACVTALKKYPQFNAALDERKESLILKRYYNVGFAADTPQGLMVPVVKNVDQKGIAEIAREVASLAEKARQGRLGPSGMQGASFTITSLGGIGGTYFTPFINAPEVAIIGLSRMSMKPVWDGSEFVPRLILPLSLAYDHRAIDGADGARFASYLAALLADMKKTLL